jgi:glyoxylase-like metal-dependent hydrolase (beta-lactamase superfamily II)
MLSLILAAAVAMQDTPPPTHRVHPARDNVYAVFGQGGNVGVIEMDDCLVMIDCQFERSLPGLLEAIRTLSDKPIRYLINTHHHSDHTNANRAMSGQVQAIIAHANTRARLAKEQEPEKRGGLPSIVVGEEGRIKTDTLTLAMGGTDVRMTYWGPAHTDNDMVIVMPGARVVHMGDTLFLEMLPYIDTEAGGSFNGLVQVVGHALGLLPEDAVVIPGHGPVCDKKELARHLEFLLAVQRHVRANPEMSPKAMAESFDKAPWEDKKPSPNFVTWETLFQAAAGKGPGRVK